MYSIAGSWVINASGTLLQVFVTTNFAPWHARARARTLSLSLSLSLSVSLSLYLPSVGQYCPRLRTQTALCRKEAWDPGKRRAVGICPGPTPNWYCVRLSGCKEERSDPLRCGGITESLYGAGWRVCGEATRKTISGISQPGLMDKNTLSHCCRFNSRCEVSWAALGTWPLCHLYWKLTTPGDSAFWRYRPMPYFSCFASLQTVSLLPLSLLLSDCFTFTVSSRKYKQNH